MGVPIGSSRSMRYDGGKNPAESMNLPTLEAVINPFRKLSVWKKVVSFLGTLPAKLREVECGNDYKGCYARSEEATGQWKTEICLTDPYGNVYL